MNNNASDTRKKIYFVLFIIFAAALLVFCLILSMSGESKNSSSLAEVSQVTEISENTPDQEADAEEVTDAQKPSEVTDTGTAAVTSSAPAKTDVTAVSGVTDVSAVSESSLKEEQKAPESQKKEEQKIPDAQKAPEPPKDPQPAKTPEPAKPTPQPPKATPAPKTPEPERTKAPESRPTEAPAPPKPEYRAKTAEVNVGKLLDFYKGDEEKKHHMQLRDVAQPDDIIDSLTFYFHSDDGGAPIGNVNIGLGIRVDNSCSARTGHLWYAPSDVSQYFDGDTGSYTWNLPDNIKDYLMIADGDVMFGCWYAERMIVLDKIVCNKRTTH